MVNFFLLMVKIFSYGIPINNNLNDKMDTESKQNSGFAADMQSSSLKEKIQKLLANKLTPMQISEGYLHSKELTYLLGCSERTLIRWRQLRKQGNVNVGIPCTRFAGTYKYFLDDIYQYFINNTI